MTFADSPGSSLSQRILEDATGHGQGIDGELGWQLLQNMVREFLCAVVFGRLSGHVPAVIVEAAKQHRKLGTEMHRRLGGQPVT